MNTQRGENYFDILNGHHSKVLIFSGGLQDDRLVLLQEVVRAILTLDVVKRFQVFSPVDRSSNHLNNPLASLARTFHDTCLRIACQHRRNPFGKEFMIDCSNALGGLNRDSFVSEIFANNSQFPGLSLLVHSMTQMSLRIPETIVPVVALADQCVAFPEFVSFLQAFIEKPIDAKMIVAMSNESLAHLMSIRQNFPANVSFYSMEHWARTW